jgi:hypothetical protein
MQRVLVADSTRSPRKGGAESFCRFVAVEIDDWHVITNHTSIIIVVVAECNASCSSQRFEQFLGGVKSASELDIGFFESDKRIVD